MSVRLVGSLCFLALEKWPLVGDRLCIPGALLPLSMAPLPPASPGGSPRLARRSDPGWLQITASALGSVACEILCTPFKSSVSICLRPLTLLKVLPAFKAKCSGSLPS